FGAYTETIEQGVSGFRCRTLGDWLAAVEQVETWGPAERRAVRSSAERYDMYRLAADYDAVFQQLADLRGEGWYSRRTTLAPVRQDKPSPAAGPHLPATEEYDDVNPDGAN